jgi:hypothetical protein
MTHIFFLLFALVSFQFSFGQTEVLGLTHYLFPEFTKGYVLMKNGIKSEAMLNFNSLTEEMLFENKGTKLAVSQLDKIDTVFINGHKFIVFNNKFLELLYSSKLSLFAEHKCSIKDPGKPAGYGGTSQTAAISSYSTYLSGGQVYELKLPEGYQTKPFVEYWLRENGQMNKFITLRQIVKLYSNKEDILKKYIKNQKVNYDDYQSLIGLVKFIEEN